MATTKGFAAALPAQEERTIEQISRKESMSSSPDAVVGEEFEYEGQNPDLHRVYADKNFCYSYEALPPGYGLSHNMMAGAFAGIAV